MRFLADTASNLYVSGKQKVIFRKIKYLQSFSFVHTSLHDGIVNNE